jgi:hypothetical protein
MSLSSDDIGVCEGIEALFSVTKAHQTADSTRTPSIEAPTITDSAPPDHRFPDHDDPNRLLLLRSAQRISRWRAAAGLDVIDRKQVILALDHPFVSGGRVASLLIDDVDLAGRLAEGFDGLWAKALKDLREVRAVPMAFHS